MIDKKAADRFIGEYATPFYLFDETGFVKNYEKLRNTFRKVYPNYEIAYSYKTNYTPYICGLVKKLGGYAEVVSDMELQLAKKIGYENERIIYNGPCKGKKLEEHILNDGILNIDNYDEAKRVASVAKRFPEKSMRVGIRINADIGANYISRFGLEMGGDELKKTFEVLSSANVRVVGFHCHISRARGLEAWKRRIDNLLEAADTYLGEVPEYIDLGSGMFAEMDGFLEQQFGGNVPTYEDYAKVVAGTMAAHYAASEKKPLLITEPGTTVVARYLYLFTKVVNKKFVSDKCFVTVDSSYYNAGEICTMKQLPYMILPAESNRDKTDGKTIDIMGYTCLEQDCIVRNFNEDLFVDDVLVFENVGGYSIVSKPPFIQPNCQVLCLSENGEVKQIKREETYEDIFKTFLFE